MTDSSILIAGGGPAGCIVALRLAELGHTPTVIATPRRQRAVEGFSRRTVEALKIAGCAAAARAVGPEIRREANWAGRESAPNSEFVVDRARFDEALLDDLGDRGVTVVRGGVVGPRRTKSGWSLLVRRDDGDNEKIEGDFLVEARGRAAPLTSRASRHGPATVSLARVIAGVDDRPRTAVAGYADGWAWYASVGGGQAILQFLVSAGPGEIPKRDGLRAFYARHLALCGQAADWIAGGRATGPVIARNAGPVRALKPVAGNSIRVGDAAMAVDPLSGHGVFVAAGGAQAAAAVVNTVLRRPGDAALARRFYEERCESDFLRHCRVGRDFYALEERWADRPFWRDRAGWPDDSPAHEQPSSTPPRIEKRPVVEHGFITGHEVVVTADHPRGVWVVDDVPLVPLLRLFEKQPDTDANNIAYVSKVFGVTGDKAETAIAWLRFRRLIR